MKQVIIKSGKAFIEEMPAPFVEAGTVLVAVEYSCISVGTEMSGLKSSSLPLWKRAMQQPDNLKKGLQMIQDQGFSKTMKFVNSKLESGLATGYSAAGRVVEVGAGITRFKVGDSVACAGAGYASHAEYIRVPENLVVPIPEDLKTKEASTVTLGAIALQGVRRANPTLGESFVVVGLGILGQLTVQMLKANGCRVIGVDLDTQRIQKALESGMDHAVLPAEGVPIDSVMRMTDGYGADGVIITAASPSDEIMSTAFKMCRKKGRVVLVGDVGLSLKRGDFYQKELDFFISTSYGPGRYDGRYEEEGLDYPISHVRWTENRNMGEYLRLLAEKKIALEPMIEAVFAIEDASKAYSALNQDGPKPLMVLLEYGPNLTNPPVRTLQISPKLLKKEKGTIHIALAGAGGFAKGMHLPNLAKIPSLKLKTVMSRTGPNAVATSKQYEAQTATTSYQEVVKDTDVDLVIIATRHNLHASMALEALNAGKSVLLEKPLALNRDELSQIVKFFSEKSTSPVLMTGFNRRFSPHIQKVREWTKTRTNPIMITYRMNAGYIPRDHWVHGPEGGGRNIGEACHIYDLFTALTQSRCTKVKVASLKPKSEHYSSDDNFMAMLDFEDGSVAHLVYTASGHKDVPKEEMDVFFDGKVIRMVDYKKTSIVGVKEASFETSTIEKGQFEELQTLAQTLKSGGEWPIPLWEQIQATEISFQVEEQLRK